MREWFNDSTHRCSRCNTIFKVYVADEEPTVDFCPVCGCCLDADGDLTEEEIEQLEN